MAEWEKQIHRAGLGEGVADPFWEAEAEDQDYLQRYTDGNNQFIS